MSGAGRRLGVALLCVLPWAAAVVSAQSHSTTGAVGGVVLDTLGAVVPNAVVTVRGRETGVTRSVAADGHGAFRFVALPLGTFDIAAVAPGFRASQIDGLIVTVGASLTVSITLQLEGVTETTTAAATIREQDPQVSATITRDMIAQLPINGRNFVSFTLMTPSVTTDRTPVQGSSATSGLTFAGQSGRANNIMLDGLDNTEAALGAVRGTLSQEAVREVEVLAHSFSAEFGKATGGVVNIVTRSGTNAFSGALFLYGRHDALNAKSYFERFDTAGRPIERAKAPFTQAQFGAVAGGPVRKDRTFFFGAIERQTTDASSFVGIDDRTAVIHPVTGAALGTPADVLRNAGFPFDNGDVPYRVRGTQAMFRLDQHWSSHGLALRINSADYLDENSEPFGGIVGRSRAGALDSSDRGAALSHTSVLSERLVTEARVQFARRDQNVFPLDPACGGPCTTDAQGGPTIEVAGVAALGRHRAMPQPRGADRYQAVGTLTAVHQHHQLKTGVDFSYIANRSAIPLHFGGRYIFAGLPAVPGGRPAMSAIQAVATGTPVIYIQGYGDARADYGYRDISLFVQDDWRIGPRLSLKGGLRYQGQLWDQVPLRDPIVGDFLFPRTHTLAPRLALSWNVTGDGRTAVHAGAGAFYGNHVTTLTSSVGIFDGIGARTLAVQGPAAAAAWNAPGHRLSEPGTPFPSLQLSVDPTLEAPLARQASAGIEHALNGNVVLSADVIYSSGRHQIGSIDYNPLSPDLGPGRRPADVEGVAGTTASVIQFRSYGQSAYRALVVTARKQRGPQTFFASYTLGSAEDNTVDFQSQFLPQFNGRGVNAADPTGLPRDFDPRLDYGPSQQDQRHRLVLTGSMEVPFGIHIAPIVTAGSGRRYSALAGFDFNRDGDATNDRARRDPTVALNNYSTTVSRNELSMPAQVAIDLRISRVLPIGALRLEGIFECFNLFNRANFTEVNGVFGSGAYPDNPLPTFGQFTQAAAPRQVQLALRLTF